MYKPDANEKKAVVGTIYSKAELKKAVPTFPLVLDFRAHAEVDGHVGSHLGRMVLPDPGLGHLGTQHNTQSMNSQQCKDITLFPSPLFVFAICTHLPKPLVFMIVS